MSKEITKRLAYLRKQIENENISYEEIVELQNLAPFIPKGDVVLLEWAGVKENKCQHQFRKVQSLQFPKLKVCQNCSKTEY